MANMKLGVPLHPVIRKARSAGTPAGETARQRTPCTFTSGRPRCRSSAEAAGRDHSCPHAQLMHAWIGPRSRALRASPERADVRLKAVQAALAVAEATAETEQGRATLAVRLPAIRRHLDRYRPSPSAFHFTHGGHSRRLLHWS